MSRLPLVDWDLAAAVAARRTAAGPEASKEQIEEAVATLHEAADRAIDLVAEASGLGIRVKPPTYALDRPSWARANTQLAQTVFERLADPVALNLRRKVSRRLTAAAFGAGLAIVGEKVIGQYDPFNVRLLLVVPNVIETEQRLGLVPRDFRLWAALHEQTHAVQFGAAPWLIDHLLGLVTLVIEDKEKERDVVEEILTVMTVLEGHADVMMDEASPGHVPTWRHLRSQFNHARAKPANKLLARLGLKSKAEQYASGSAFVRGVLDSAGRDALNRVFDGAGYLPDAGELANPTQWLRRTQA